MVAGEESEGILFKSILCVWGMGGMGISRKNSILPHVTSGPWSSVNQREKELLHISQDPEQLGAG